MKSKLPTVIETPDGKHPVIQEDLFGKLGYYFTDSRVIGIEKNQPEAGKHLILLHELIHFVAEKLKEEGSSTASQTRSS